MNTPTHVKTRSSLQTSREWLEYKSGDFGTEFQLVSADNRLPAAIIMTEDGDLNVRQANGKASPLTNLPAWLEIKIQPLAVLATQTAGFIALW